MFAGGPRGSCDRSPTGRTTMQDARHEAERAAQGIDWLVRNVETGHFERSLSALTAIGALVTAAEIYFEHDSALFLEQDDVGAGGFGPVGAAAGVAGFFSRRMAKTALPLASFAIVANGLQGTYLHARGIGQKPGGWSTLVTTWRWGRRCLASARDDGWRHGPACSGTPARKSEPEARRVSSPIHQSVFRDFDVLGQGQALGPRDSRCRARPPHGPHSHLAAVLHSSA